MNRVTKLVSLSVIAIMIMICAWLLLRKLNNEKQYTPSDSGIFTTYAANEDIYNYDEISDNEQLVADYAQSIGVKGVINTLELGEADNVEEFLIESGYDTFYTIYSLGVTHYFVIDDGDVIELQK